MPPRTPLCFLLLSLLCLTLLLSPLKGAAQGAAFWPDDPYFTYDATLRPDFPGQWHLFNGAPAQILFNDSSGNRTTMVNAGVDAGLKAAWALGYTGKGVIIGIVDDGVDGENPDIDPNYRADLSRNFSDYGPLATAAQEPQRAADNHGTAVAGVAAARGGNAIGGTGAAPYAEIAALRINLGADTPTDPDSSAQNFLDAYYWKSGVNTTTGTIEAKADIQVKNHSYGPTRPFLRAAGSESLKQALERTAANNVIHVFSAGNYRGAANEDATKTYEGNSSAVIVVAALGSDGKYANYSSYGANVFVTAPSNRSDFTGFGITTTDRAGEDLGYNRYSDANPKGDADDGFPDTNYTSTFGGTSSSAPLVSGIMALGEEANPLMDVRLAKHLLVRTSDKVDAADSLWATNGAGYHFNPNYGFGNINAGKFVAEARKSGYVTQQTSYATGTVNVGAAIPDNDPNGFSRTFTLTGALLDQPLEGVEVTLNVTHEKRGDLTAELASPSSMTSRLFHSTSGLPADKQDAASVTNYEWTFLTNAFWGEAGIGLWTLTLSDVAAGNTGTWNSYSAKFLMGRLVFKEAGRTVQTADIRAEALFLADRDVTFEIPKTPGGITFEVEEGVLIEAGELIVNGDLTEAAGRGGSEVVLIGGTLSGSGNITASRGLLNSGGLIAPGNSIGTLTLHGDYIQGAGGSLLIEVESTTVNDLFVVNGAASLDGTLETKWTGGAAPALGSSFAAFLTATGGVTGQFSRLLTNITPTTVFKPRYDLANQVYLVTERDYANLSLSAHLTANGQAVGGMLTGAAGTASGDLGTVLNALDALPTYTGAASAIEQLAPINGAVSANLELSGTQFQSSRIADRLGELRLGARGISLGGLRLINADSAATAGRQPIHLASNTASLAGMIPAVPIPEPEGERWGVFAKGDVILGEQRGTGQAGYDFTTTGVTIGLDYRFSEHLIAGIMAGLQGARANVNDAGGSKAKLDADGLGLYGTYHRQGFYLDGLAHYGRNRFDNRRRILFPGLDRTALSKPDGSQLALHGGAGYEFEAGSWMVSPAVSLQYVRGVREGYSETGADVLNLRVDKQVTESLRGSLGGRVSRGWEMGWGWIVPGIRAAYSHEFAEGAKSVQAALAQGSSPFTVGSASPAKHSLLLGADVTALFPGGMQAYLGYNGQIGSDRYQAHGVSGGIRFTF